MIDPLSEVMQPPAAEWLVGGGEMGALIRSKEWAATPLGPIERWPQSLRSAVSILLPSKAQIVLFWGPELVTIYNDAYRPVFGAKHPIALGMPAYECWSEVWDVLEPLFSSVVATGEAFWGRDLLFGIERYGYVEETYFDVSYDPIRDESGRVGGIFCIVSETTGRLVGERRLAALRDLGRIGDGATSQDDVFRNAAAVLERYRKDVPFVILYGWDAREGAAHLAAAAGLAASELQAAARNDSRHKTWPIGGRAELLLAERAEGVALHDGPWPEKTTRAAVLKIAAPGAEPSGYLVAGLSSRRAFDDDYRDFLRLVGSHIASAVAGVHALEDERKRAEALAEIDRAKTAFFSNVSHEFRTPLTLMLGPLEELLAKNEDGMAPEDRALLTAAQRNAQRLLRLVNTLLDFARIEAGRTQASYQPTDVASLTADLASNFRSACERAGIRLQVDCAPSPEALYLDHEMWEKIVLNLLSNAFKFTLEGEIRVRLRDAGQRVELDVSDTGTGVTAEELPRIFERFHRVENAAGRSHEGSGIGLALVHELVKLHGGSITVRSVWGAGTTFTVAIPKGSAHLPPGRVKAARETPSSTAARAGTYVAEALGWLPAQQTSLTASPQGAPRILVADDNADLREYARRLLGEHYEVRTAPDGLAALEAARALKPDIIISDVMMPRLDGFGLIREVRADQELQAIPIILLSARAGEEARIEGLGKGADDYLVKPFSARELLVRVGSLIKSAEMHRRADEARAQFETLLNAAPLGVYVVDEDFRIAAVNPLALPMFNDIPDLIGRDFENVLQMLAPKDYAREIAQIFRRTLETGEPHVVPEYVGQRPDRGGTRYYEWQINRIPLPGDRRGVVCYFRDISKAVLAREALRESDSRKDEFLATLSHELRNPLAPLRSSLEVLKRVGAEGRQAGLAIDVMQRQLSHLVRLVDDLLEVSRITRGAVELRKERVRLDSVLRHALEASEPLIRARNHRVHLSIPPEPIVLMADPVRLAQVFGNLLNNAAKYSDERGEITIEARREAGEAVIAIRDAGDGIEPEQLPKLFQIFMRGERGARRNQSGLGIGLALVQRLTEMHGGGVEATSEGAGKGSCFTVRLPLSSEHQAAPQSAAEHASQTIPALRVLVIDDNRDAAESLAMLLETMGAEVRVAHDGAHGLLEYEKFRPLVVLLDIGMPGMDGYEVARRLRALREAPRACIVALTGWGQDEDRRRVREAGFDHHLVKPADVADLQTLIAAIQDAPR
jgi:PAS domain S-box-containing protein